MSDVSSPSAQGPVKVTIVSEGRPLSDIQVTEVKVVSGLNRVPSACIALLDGSLVGQGCPLSDNDAFTPGKTIEIKSGYGSESDTLFEGVVRRHRLRMDGETGSHLMIECQDPSYVMTSDRNTAVNVNKKDSDVLRSLIEGYSGLQANVAETNSVHEDQMQYDSSDWDYVLARARVNDMVVVAESGMITVAPPELATSPVLTLTMGEDLIGFDASIDGYTQTHKAGLALVEGSMSFPGSARAKPGCLLKLAGISKRFDGQVLASRIEHVLAEGDWITHVEFGLSARRSDEQAQRVASRVDGWGNASAGLQVGVVKKLDQDLKQQHRVQVSLGSMGEAAAPVWARLLCDYASNGFGRFLVPEIGDEVLIGFLDDALLQPVILGSLYSRERPPAEPYELNADNNLKALVTRSKLKVEFDEQNKSITLETPAGNLVVLNDAEKSITLLDQNENKFVMSPEGIALSSAKNVSIAAQGSVSINAGTSVEIGAESDVTLEASNISHKARLGFTASGNASAELSASGQTTVKGAMVMIN